MLVGAEPAAAAGSVPAAAGCEAAVHDNWDLWRLHPFGTGDLRTGLLGCQGDVFTLALGAGTDAAGLLKDGLHNGLVPAVQRMNGVLAPQRVFGGVHGGDAQAGIDDLETSQVVGKEKVFEVASYGHETRAEVGLEVLVVAVWSVIFGIAAALKQIPRKGGEEDDLLGLQQAQ